MKIFKICLLFLAFYCFRAFAIEVTHAGFAFSGDYATAGQRFPYTFKLFKNLQSKNNVAQSFSRVINERAKTLTNSEIDFRLPENLVNLKNSDQALMTALVLTGETVGIEKHDSYYKTFVNLRGSTLIFDYKNQTIVRSYPVSVVIFDATSEKPSEKRILEFVDDLIRREDGRGLITQYLRRLQSAKLPKEGTRTIQVRTGEISSEALQVFPDLLKRDLHAVQAMFTEGFASILSAKLEVPMLPSSIGHTEGVMSMRLENGDDYKLKVEEGDYLFDIKLNKFAKIKYAENNIGTSYIYGAYMTIKFYEPSLNTEYINTDIKNGEVAEVPRNQISREDYPGYEDAMRKLVLKFADAFKNPSSDWLSKAASEKNIEIQMKNAQEIIRKCQ